MRRAAFVGAVVVWSLLAQAARGEDALVLRIEDGGPAIAVGHELWARLRVDDGPKPYVWPLRGPGGQDLTRAYPMEKIAGEQHDHPHHRSLWFTHGEVNGVDFWSEGPGRGRIAHREFVEMASTGESVMLVSDNDWLAPDGKKVCTDRRRITFRAATDRRTIDFEIALQASEGDVKLGDTKEGTFGVRVASSMSLPQGGHIVNSQGQRDREAWGKQAAWVDYFGTVEGQPAGVAIFNHPSSFRFPTYWHVRDYGLFAANPFGWHDFQGNESVDGSYRIPAGERIILRYRVLLHGGDWDAARIAQEFAVYSQEMVRDL